MQELSVTSSCSIVWALVFMFFSHCSPCFGLNTPGAVDLKPGGISKHIQYSFTLHNRSGQTIDHADFWTYAPLTNTSAQAVTKLEASHPFERIVDELGNQILHFRLKQFPPFATQIIRIKANLVFDKNKEKLTNDSRKIFLGSEEHTESRHPKIVKQAKQLRGATGMKTVTNIFYWVDGHIEYAGYAEQRKGALSALETTQGDCTEFMDLFVALTRANDIPARGIAGYVIQENGILTPLDFHNWAEFFAGDSWQIADPQKKAFMENQSDYVAMRIIGPSSNNPMGEFNRFKFEGNGLMVTMNH